MSDVFARGDGAAEDMEISFGEARLHVQRGALGPLRASGHELIRRIFITVRDDEWQETSPSEWTVTQASAEQLSIAARHRSDRVDFRWRGELTLDPARSSASFSFEGEALRDMAVCRLGLIVLCPVDLMAGADVTASGPAGQEHLRLDDALQPQKIREGLPSGMSEPFDAVTIRAADDRRLQLRFSGDLFEMEDQRNWGDASFKVYCTPLRLGFPRSVAKGTVIRHQVQITYEIPKDAGATSPPSAQRVDTSPPLPQIATMAPGGGVLALELDSDATPISKIAPSTTLDVGLTAACLTERKALLEELLARHGGAIARVRLSGNSVALPSAGDVQGLRGLLKTHGREKTPIFAATRGYFVEFNRGEPFSLAVDGVAFPVSPTVHSDDARTTRENVAVIADMVASARSLTGCSAVAIAPLAWRYPGTKAEDAPSEAGHWALAALINAARTGATSVILAEDVDRALAKLGCPRTGTTRDLADIAAQIGAVA